MSNRPIIGVTVGTPMNPQKFSGTSDYSTLENKPKINGMELKGNVTLVIPNKTSQLNNDLGYVTNSELTKAIQDYDNDVMSLLGSDDK